MADKYRNKYRISSIRLQNWDYSWDAGYIKNNPTKWRDDKFLK